MDEKIKEIEKAMERRGITGGLKHDIDYLLSHIKELEKRLAEAEWSGGWAIDPGFYVEKIKLDETEIRVKEFEEGIEKHKNIKGVNANYLDRELYRLLEKEE